MAGSPDLWADWGEFGKFNARGMKGGEALILELNRIVYSSGIASPVTSKRGLKARLRYLDSPAGRQALKGQGVTARTLRSWTEGKSTPMRANLIRSGWLKRHLDNGGRGRRMEVYPVDQSHVPAERARATLQQRSINVRYIWGDLVDAWASQAADTVDEIWDDVISDLDSDYGAYAYVASVGIGA
ncbi:hypothetical protein PUR59_02460 [Streptomyces sp. SP18ES09]|uniref:hypothetical protein n=1 Tax=Streptomyces sp. SP18ES09 TaxID=3002532 RepID=UPI002E769337|nr:hypothetical protein [Streptomyces sp. SP18ES09]MEE1813891.1 hypothetical protein [Streptomyces sp. SP18ES09]